MYRNETLFYRTKKSKYVKEYGYLLFVGNLFNKNRKKSFDTPTKTGLDAVKKKLSIKQLKQQQN